MKRKLIYAIIFISIFLMSSASMVSPVQGYEPPDIPAEAKGMTLDDTEVTVYDEDEMEDHLGKKFDIKDIKAGDADVVGARSQMKIIDWETDEDLIKYESVWVYEAVGFEASADEIRLTLWELGNITQFVDTLPPMIEMMEYVTNLTLPGDSIANATVNADTLADLSISSWDVLMGIYADKYDGTILEREIWDFLDPAEEFDNSDPDTDDDEVPYLLDPRDWVDSFYNVRALGQYIVDKCDDITDELTAYMDGLIMDFLYYGDTKLPALNATWDGYLTAAGPAGVALRGLLGSINDQAAVASYIFSIYVVSQIKYNTLSALPDKFGYLLQLLEAGQPCSGPAADFIKKAVKEFNIREGPYKIPWISYGEDWLGLFGVPNAVGVYDGISVIPYGLYLQPTINPDIIIPLGGETVYIYANVDVEVDDAGVVTVEIEYLDDQQDPKDMIKNYITPGSEDDPDELDDWEWVFPKAGDGPTQMKDGDTIFYQTEPMEGPIPGYEIPVLIGVSLVSVIGLIYVVMKKRKK